MSRRPNFLTVSLWRSRVSPFYTAHGTEDVFGSTFSHSNTSPSNPPSLLVPELIYKVLDLVPVLQVKQLVRSLGVKDTEIEQAELDYRSCREAHYQMLRIWAERGLRAGGLLQWSFLQGLLDELRKMHLENAAEELETIYGFQ